MQLKLLPRCALATLRLGYEVFAIRQMGVCATSKDLEKSTTWQYALLHCCVATEVEELEGC